MGASTTTSTMFGVSRMTSCTTARSSSFSFLSSVGRLGRGRQPAGQESRNHRITLLRAGHGLHHVAGERRMQIAEETDPAPVCANRHQHARLAPASPRARASPDGRLRRPPGTICRRGRHCAGSSRPSTVLGCVPPPPESTCAGIRTGSPADAFAGAARRRGRTDPPPPLRGVSDSANRMPSSSALATSS